MKLLGAILKRSAVFVLKEKLGSSFTFSNAFVRLYKIRKLLCPLYIREISVYWDIPGKQPELEH